MEAQRSISRSRPSRRVILSGVALVAAVLTAGCATTADEEIAALQTAEAQYARAQSTARIDEFASQSMEQAERNLRRAQSLADEGADRDQIEHHAFLTQRHVEIAEARLNRGLIQEEISNADRRQQELQLAAEQRRSARRGTAATEAEQRAEEAEARLALTQQELAETQQAAQGLAQELKDLKVKQEERGTVFTLSDVVFDVDSDELNRGGERSVTRIAETLKKYPKGHILIEGYTDSTGSDEYNAQLSERRAKAVKSLFVKEGIPEDRIRTEGYGEEYPVANNDTPQGRQLNRRVEIVVSDDDRPVEPRAEASL
jgi:outer membrane protein OmpA-like peptidoglycan-associated protein